MTAVAALLEQLDTPHWVARAEHHREQDGGYAFESLAFEMVFDLGWSVPAKVAQHVGELADNDLGDRFAWLTEAPKDATAVALYECLGWAQSVLFSAFFRSLSNWRMVRDDFPGGGGIPPYSGAITPNGAA